MAELPPCPRGHTNVKVVRDGVQRRGGRERQRYRCVALDGSYHRFLGALGRTRTDQGTCLECENHIAVHEGPAAPAEFEYLVREIADALVALGRGSSYTDTARRVRLMANVGKTGERRDVVNGQTVAEWVADFTPVVAARHQEAAWPDCLVRRHSRTPVGLRRASAQALPEGLRHMGATQPAADPRLLTEGLTEQMPGLRRAVPDGRPQNRMPGSPGARHG